MSEKPKPEKSTPERSRQVIYWNLLSSLLMHNEVTPTLQQLSQDTARKADLPIDLLDANITIEMLLHRFPKLKPSFEKPLPGFESQELEDNVKKAPAKSKKKSVSEPSHQSLDFNATVEQALVASKILLNAFGPNTQGSSITAQQFSEWVKDIACLEKAMGLPTGSLLGGQNQQLTAPKLTAPTGLGGEASRPPIGDAELQAGLAALEADMIKRMDLREVLKDDKLASKLTPSMALVEQMLWDKGNLSGKALTNAKMLIRKYVDQLADIFKIQVRQAVSRKRDSSVPPKKVFKNLDMKRTIDKNLINWDPEEGKLYVDKLYYLSTGKKSLPTTLVIIVDQSGSMTDSMVQTTILASIFAGLPNVKVHLFAFDTRVIDLTAYVHDPVETLLRTKLGGGNDMRLALDAAAPCITNPEHTAVVVISDFYDWSDFFTVLKAWKESGCKLIPVGALRSSGYFMVSPEYRQRFKELGAPILNGSPKKLIAEIRKIM